MKRFVLPLLLLALSFSASAQEKASPIKVKSTDAAFVLSQGKIDFLTYHKAEIDPPAGVDPVYKRSGFIHPLTTPSGEVVTGIHPKDHFHHLGLWHAWVNGKWDGQPFDSWNIGKKLGDFRYSGSLMNAATVEMGSFQVEQEHLHIDPKGKETLVLKEMFTIVAREKDGAYEIDYQVNQKNVSDKALEFPAYRYGGPIAYRSPLHWDATNSDYRTSEGKTRADGHATRGRWCTMWGPGKLGAEKISITIMDHPSNFDAPQLMRLWSEKQNKGTLFFNYVPRQEKALVFKPGQQHNFKYRLIVADGVPTQEELGKRWDRFSQKAKK